MAEHWVEAWVVVPLDGYVSYGPFINIDVAHAWSADHPDLCPLLSTRILNISHPGCPDVFIARMI